MLAKKINKFDEQPTKSKSGKQFDFSNYLQRHIFLKFLYLGWHHDGLVESEGTANTIEDHLFAALIKTKLVESRETCNFQRCGRTDKGVSAFEQVVSLNIRSALTSGPDLIRYSGEKVDHNSSGDELDELDKEMDYVRILNSCLPSTIRAVAWRNVPSQNFSARFDCKRRRYTYYFPRMDLDLEQMNNACQWLIGEHDFRNLCKMDIANNVVNYKRAVFKASVAVCSGNDPSDRYAMCCFKIEASAFLWHQIRCIMSLLILVGRRLESHTIIGQLLAEPELSKGKPSYSIASELPLVLSEASYDFGAPNDVLNTWRYGHEHDNLKQVIGDLHCQWLKASIQTSIVRDMINSLAETLSMNEEQMDSADCGNNQMFAFLAGIKAFKPSRGYKPLLERPRCKTLEEHLANKKDKIRIVSKRKEPDQ